MANKKMKKNHMTLIILAACIPLLLSSCVSVKGFQKNKLNDGEMELANRKVEKPESNFQSYREGASGANGGKVGGGCGCN